MRSTVSATEPVGLTMRRDTSRQAKAMTDVVPADADSADFGRRVPRPGRVVRRDADPARDPTRPESAVGPVPRIFFTRGGVLHGCHRCLPLAAGLTPYGLVAGVIAQGHGLSLAEATLMSAAAVAGSLTGALQDQRWRMTA